MCGSALPSAEAYCGATTREEFPALRELFNQGRKNLLGDRPLRSTRRGSSSSPVGLARICLLSRMLKAQPTAIQNITLNLIFAAMGECRFNRKHHEYMAISNRLPRLKQLTFQVNRLLQQLHRCNKECKGFVLPQICRFKAGDQRIVYEPYPNSISDETVRAALVAAGMRKQRWRRLKSL